MWLNCSNGIKLWVTWQTEIFHNRNDALNFKNKQLFEDTRVDLYSMWTVDEKLKGQFSHAVDYKLC